MKLLPEEQFIIQCLRLEFSGKFTDELKNFDLSHIDWEMVYEKSKNWCVAPLLGNTIKKHSLFPQLSGISGDFLQKIKTAHVNTFLINQINFNKLFRVVNVFNEKGIKTILLKGTHLAHFVYPDAGLRLMGDTDIMVRKEDLLKAEELLFQAGYNYIQKSKNPQAQAVFIKRYKTNYHHLLDFSSPKGIKALELHWSIVHPSLSLNVDVEGLWERAKNQNIKGIDVLTLSPEDILLHVSLHASYEDKFICGIRTLCDIAAIVNHYADKIDGNQLKIRAHKWGAAKSLYLTLYFSQEILGLCLTPGILDALNPEPFNEKMAFQIRKHIFLPVTVKPAATRAINPENFHYNLSLSKKISNVFHRIFIPKKELALHYLLPSSSKRVYFYYVVRLVSLIYNKTPSYFRFFLYLLTHQKADFHEYNLDTWLISSDPEKIKKAE